MPDAKMNVIEMSEPGGPEVLIMGTRELPKPTDSQVLIKVTAAGVNGPDLVQRKGFYPPPKGASDLLGLEVSGEIVSMGREVQKWEIGDRVCALTNGGGYAEYVAVETAHCLPIPDDMSEIDAAGLPETYFTVWSNVFYAQKLPEGGLFLAHGGAGGIGSTAIQLGSGSRAKLVLQTSSSIPLVAIILPKTLKPLHRMRGSSNWPSTKVQKLKLT